jgi:hypothetical protein
VKKGAVCFFLISMMAFSSSCSRFAYDQIQPGKFEGKLTIRWVEPDRFVYIPDRLDPLSFTTPGRPPIVAGIMSTDGGSIPRLFWGVPGYSPWGYAPAYIIHDWLFLAHHCAFPEYQTIEFEDSAQILAEGIKTLMVAGIAPEDETTLWAIYEAVKSRIAKSIWNNPNACNQITDNADFKSLSPPGVFFMEIDMKRIPRR